MAQSANTPIGIQFHQQIYTQLWSTLNYLEFTLNFYTECFMPFPIRLAQKLLIERW